VIEAAYGVCRNLAEHPELGPLRRFPDDDPPGMRFIVISAFPNYLVFYRTTSEGVEIVRFLHAAQDIDDMFS
jgi:toxin ParE1/3/4